MSGQHGSVEWEMNLTLQEARVQAEEASKAAVMRDALQAQLADREAACAELSKRLETVGGEVHAAEKKLAEKQATEAREEYSSVVGQAAAELAASSELTEPFQDSECVFQLMGFTLAEAQTSVARVFFVLQFYHFPAVRTASARLRPVRPQPRGGGGGTTAEVLHVLVKDSGSGGDTESRSASAGEDAATVPGLSVSFFVNGERDPTHLPGYLASGVAHIEVWDAESLVRAPRPSLGM